MIIFMIKIKLVYMNFIKGDFIDQTVNDFPNVDNDFILLKEED